MCVYSFIALALVRHFTIWEVEVCELGENVGLLLWAEIGLRETHVAVGQIRSKEMTDCDSAE